MTILPVTYFGPVGWWNKLDVSDSTVFDINENYIKQTYRNRCRILSCNGLLTLSIPVKKVDGNHTLLKNMRIDNNQNWQIRHYRAVLSAYKASAFFDYYIDDIIHIWQKHYDFLADVCIDSYETICNIMDKHYEATFSPSYIIPDKTDIDLRKGEEFDFGPFDEYCQVFSDRFSFFPNLSIIDLLFNNGTSK